MAGPAVSLMVVEVVAVVPGPGSGYQDIGGQATFLPGQADSQYTVNTEPPPARSSSQYLYTCQLSVVSTFYLTFYQLIASNFYFISKLLKLQDFLQVYYYYYYC